MSRNRLLVLIAILTICVSDVHAFGRSEKAATVSAENQGGMTFRTSFPEDARQGVQAGVRAVQVRGTIRIIGTSTFPDLVISGTEVGSQDSQTTYWYIIGDERESLHNMQYQTLLLEGEENVIELRFANGSFAGLRRELRNIKIIE